MHLLLLAIAQKLRISHKNSLLKRFSKNQELPLHHTCISNAQFRILCKNQFSFLFSYQLFAILDMLDIIDIIKYNLLFKSKIIQYSFGTTKQCKRFSTHTCITSFGAIQSQIQSHSICNYQLDCKIARTFCFMILNQL